MKKKEYLRGEGSTDECAELFKEYKSCLNVGFCLSSLFFAIYHLIDGLTVDWGVGFKGSFKAERDP